MNGRILGQPQPSIIALQQVVGCYMQLLPIVATSVLNDKDAIPYESPGVIADIAWKITLEAMKKIGISVPELPKEQP